MTYCNFVLQLKSNMSSLSSTTLDINIQNPEFWTLILRLDEVALTFVLYNDKIENSLISRQLQLDKNSGDYLKSLENCVYDNPVLLQDYKSVAVEICSPHFVVVPSDNADEESARNMLDYMYPNDKGDMHVCGLTGDDVSIAFKIDKGVISFLQRTFNMPLIVHQLVPLCRYSYKKSEKSGISRMYVHLRDDRMEMCIFKKGNLTIANTFRFQAIEDAAYFMLNAWQSYGLDIMSDEMQLSGDKALREQLNPILRKYVTYVMPIIFPASAMRIGQDAIKAPFDLILLSQCVL